MPTQIGPVVRRLREQYRMTQQDVVEYAHLDRSSSYISAIETNKTSPTLFELERIAQVFRTTAVNLIHEAQEGAAAPAPVGGESSRILDLYESLSQEDRALGEELLQLLLHRASRAAP